MPDEDELIASQRRLSLLESHVGFKLEHVLDHALGVRDSYTRDHSRRVLALSEAIGARMQLDDHQMDVLSLAAGLHDIGKIGIPDRVLLKTGQLTAHEYDSIKAHPVIGANMLRSLANPMLDEVANCVLHHHEHWDGNGYPDGLAGEDIPLLSRIVAVVDAYDAMTTKRSYRIPVEKSQAIEIISCLSGSQFCPGAVKAFLNAIPEN